MCVAGGVVAKLMVCCFCCRIQRDLDAELSRSMRQLQQQEPGVRIERREELSPGSYRCVMLVAVVLRHSTSS